MQHECVHRTDLPTVLGTSFSTTSAIRLGVTPGRLRNRELLRPFRGVRVQRDAPMTPETSRYERSRRAEIALISALAQRLVPGQFFSHRSAAVLWGVPLPHRETPALHLSVHQPMRAPRVSGVVGHAVERGRCTIRESIGMPVASPGHTWAMLGDLTVEQLVIAGDFLVRVHRPGYGRPDVGRDPLTSIEELAAIVELGRWRGIARLRRALPLLRVDSWSPQESVTRVTLVRAGLPEPELNCDIFDESGCFLGCVDMAFRRYRVIVEYQGIVHAESYAEDVERLERLQTAGWTVIQVTRELSRNRAQLVARVAAALREHGWDGISCD